MQDDGYMVEHREANCAQEDQHIIWCKPMYRGTFSNSQLNLIWKLDLRPSFKKLVFLLSKEETSLD